jgi:hypothetical protein
MAYEHNSEAYLVVIRASRVHELALDLYHAVSRGEPTGHEVGQIQQAMQDLSKAFDDWAMDEGDE